MQKKTSKILIVDDDTMICELLVERFQMMGYEALSAQSLKEGIDAASSEDFDVVFLDVNLPDGNGLAYIDKFAEKRSNPEIIIMTGEGDPDGAELAMQANVWDYIIKRGSQKNIKLSLSRAMEYRRQKLASIGKKEYKRTAIIGESKKIKTCIDTAAKASKTDISILITGETGTGKELFAKSIHDNSRRHENDFVVVDCAALPEHLVESVLFGHSKGAFTSADSDKDGLIRIADRGTLFLDEVGELPMTIQKKFLRALQEKRIRPVGSKKEIPCDFRLVAATHRDLTAMVKKGAFREDLYYRIASLELEIPPLRERQADIPLLAIHCINNESEILGQATHEMSGEFMEQLMRFNWPGNIRELFNALYSACSQALGEEYLFPNHLPSNIRAFNIKAKINESRSGSMAQQRQTGQILKFKDQMERMKFEYVTHLLSTAHGDIKKALTLSGLSRSHLYRLMQQYDISIT